MFQAGKFSLAKNLTIPQIAQKLTNAKSENITITFPEGFSLLEMDDKLVELQLIQAGEFLQCVQKTCNL